MRDSIVWCVLPLADIVVSFVWFGCVDQFGFVVSNVMHSEWSYSIEASALLGGLSQGVAVFLCPLLGLLLDRIGYKMYVCVAAGVLSCAAYLLLAFHIMSALYPLLLLSLCISVVPTILRSSVPALVSPTLYGAAFGTYEVCESVGSVVGHVLVGYVRDTTHSYFNDLIIFAVMAGSAAAVALALSCIDHKMGGSLNKPSYRSKHHIQHNKSELERLMEANAERQQDHPSYGSTA